MYCPKCDKEVDIDIDVRGGMRLCGGELVDNLEEVIACKECGNELYEYMEHIVPDEEVFELEKDHE